MRITSTSNPRIKQIRKLKSHKERMQSGSFFIEGLRIVGEAFEQKAQFEYLVYAPGLLTSEFGQKIVAYFKENDLDVLETSDEVFRSISSKDGPQGIAAVLSWKLKSLADLNLEKGDLWVALDSIQDPGNLGTILRTCDAVGGKGLILLDQSTDPYSLAATRASMGALFSQEIVIADFITFKEWRRNNPVAVVATSDVAELDYHQYSYPDPMILLMGSEREGLHQQYYELCDAVVRIPMVGKSDSLNLAVASGVSLYEIFNQRRFRRA